MAINQKLFELQPYGLTCVVSLTSALIGIFLFKLKCYLCWFETECPSCLFVVYWCCEWLGVWFQSPATPTIAASQYMYPMQTLPPEVIYAQLPPQAAFQPGDIADGSVIETAPAEVGHS